MRKEKHSQTKCKKLQEIILNFCNVMRKERKGRHSQKFVALCLSRKCFIKKKRRHLNVISSDIF